MTTARNRLPYLDGLRGIAILLVMFHHFTVIQPRSPMESYLYRVSEFGAQGVDLFFVLSGFLITGILIDSKRNEHFFRTFYLRRALRICPVFYLLIAFSFCVLPVLFKAFPEYSYKLARFDTVS